MRKRVRERERERERGERESSEGEGRVKSVFGRCWEILKSLNYYTVCFLAT